ncbi:hypothetical protein ACQZV8_00605 [Magnetococcales bacterium HHB-1]
MSLINRSFSRAPGLPATSGWEMAVRVLRPEEGRKLIGEAVASLSRVLERTQNGHMVIVGGTTTRYVARALTGDDPGDAQFAVGWIKEGKLGESPEEGRGEGPFLFEQGEVSRGWPKELLKKFSAGDIYIKGANALDPEGNVLILMGSSKGGTIGLAISLLHARGGELIIPISLEKLIPSVPEAAKRLGKERLSMVTGTSVGAMSVMAGTATVFTELEACAQLFGIEATHIVSGGLDDCAGAVTLHLQGPKENLRQAWEHLDRTRAQLEKQKNQQNRSL